MATPAMKTTKTARVAIHRLVDELPDGELQAAKRYMEYLRNMKDPLVRKLSEAPYDDEPLTEDDEAALQQGLADIAAGRVYTAEEVKRELGL